MWSSEQRLAPYRFLTYLLYQADLEPAYQVVLGPWRFEDSVVASNRIHLWLTQRKRGTHWKAVGKTVARGTAEEPVRKKSGRVQPWEFGEQELTDRPLNATVSNSALTPPSVPEALGSRLLSQGKVFDWCNGGPQPLSWQREARHLPW